MVGPTQCRAAPQVLNPWLRAKGCSAVGKERQTPASTGADAGAVVRLAGMRAREALGKAGCRFTRYELRSPPCFPRWPGLHGAMHAAGDGRGVWMVPLLFLPGLPPSSAFAAFVL